MTISSVALALTLAWSTAQPNYAWHFPQDHWAHHGYKTEWWYFTGHLSVDGAPRFAYQFTIFNVGIGETPLAGSAWSTTTLLMGHAAITDIKTGEHRFTEVVQRLMPAVASFGNYPESRIAWCHAASNWELVRDAEGFAFTFADARQGYSFSLHTRPTKPVTFEGYNGYSRKGGDAASEYYSETRDATQGELVVDGTRYTVSGDTWMDKEFGSSMLGDDQSGWDWFSLQLDDGREVMLYVLRHSDNSVSFKSGTIVDMSGVPAYIDAFTVEDEGRWASPESKARYPAHWRIHAAGLDLDITPVSSSQENVSHLVPGLFYWEGAVRVSGSQTGRGFAELTGYGSTLSPALGGK